MYCHSAVKTERTEDLSQTSSDTHTMLLFYFILLFICFIYKDEMAGVTTVFLVALLADIYTVVECNNY